MDESDFFTPSNPEGPPGCSCGGAVVPGRSTHTLSGDHYTFILEDIPAYKCTRCDRVLFSEDIVERIHALKRRLDRECNEIVTGQPTANLYEY
jgi:YgiT-type zinc finger domain-containing protein